MHLKALALLIITGLTAGLHAENWPAFRGPSGNGKSSEKNLPSTWSPTENIKWKLKLPGPGSSSPIIWENKIFLSQSLNKEGSERALLCIDRKDGKILWQKSITYQEKEPTHSTNPYCSGTPVTDGSKIIVSFGSAGLFCFDFDGNILWNKDLGKCIHLWGNSTSPILHKNLVILNFGPGENSFLLALDKNTGKEIWRANEPGGSSAIEKGQDWLGSWATPALHTNGPTSQLIMPWPNNIKSYNPDNGQLLWTCQGITKLVYTSPLVDKDIVVAMSGYHGSAMAVKTDGKGDVTHSHKLWINNSKNPQRIGTGIIHDNHLFMANAGPGNIQCIDILTGKDLWENQRLGANHWGSMIYADGKLYATDQNGDTFILEAKPVFKQLGKNSLKEHTDATLAIADKELFIRTFQHLWCISAQK
ncbi:MAG: serine/threonine protein kinase [Planctomycetes bacterium]|nr:serine/threonine protein kinase [Planctomycetota bacterium]